MKGDRPETGTGGCLCGAVRFQAMGEPVVTGHCHCADCRRHNGAPVVTLVIFEADKVWFTEGKRKISQSSAVYIPRSSYNLVRSSLGAPAFVGTAHFRAWYPAE